MLKTKITPPYERLSHDDELMVESNSISNQKRISQYTCSNYSKMPVGVLCPTQHRINEIAILNLVSYSSGRLPNTIGKLLEVPKPECSQFIVDTKTRFLKQRDQSYP